MNHGKYKRLIDEYFFGEINTREKIELEEHLKNCKLCRSEFYSSKVLKESLLKNELPEPDEGILNEARNELRSSMRIEKLRAGFLENIIGWLTGSFFINTRLAAAAFLFLLVGIILGYFVFHSAGTIHYTLEDQQQQTLGQNAMLSGDTRISNIRFIDKNPENGSVEFTFDAVKPVHIKGKINDPEVQNILMYSMLNEDNPGTRLNTINLLSSNSQSRPDKEIKDALLSVVKFDYNQGVRWEAIKLLKKFRFDEDIKNTMLYVLQNDSSSGMRIEAMNILVQANKEGSTFNREDLSIFRQKLQQDNNNYIRYQAQTVLKEYK